MTTEQLTPYVVIIAFLLCGGILLALWVSQNKRHKKEYVALAERLDQAELELAYRIKENGELRVQNTAQLQTVLEECKEIKKQLNDRDTDLAHVAAYVHGVNKAIDDLGIEGNKLRHRQGRKAIQNIRDELIRRRGQTLTKTTTLDHYNTCLIKVKD